MTDARCYTVPQVLEKLQMTQRTFTRLKQKGELTYVQELLPRSGRRARYRADLIDQYLSGQYPLSRSFASHRKLSLAR